MEPLVFRPLTQSQWWGSTVHYELRIAGLPADVMRAVTTAASQTSGSISLKYIMLDEQIAQTLRRPRMLAMLSGFFGLIAVALAVIGLYGTMAYRVAGRRNEIGVRLALGARQGRVLAMVLGEAGVVVAVGLVIGIGVALAGTRILSGVLFGLKPNDAITYIGAATLLAVAALGAATLPAWKASKTDPAEVMRAD